MAGEEKVANADAAINRVLDAERKARDAIALCRSNNEQRVEQAQQLARRIDDRADLRIGRIHGLADRSILLAKAGFDERAQRLEHAHTIDPRERQALEAAARQLIDEWLVES